MTIDPNDYKVLVSFLESACGIEMEPGKDYLFESRLQPLVLSLGFTSIANLVAEMRRGVNKQLSKQIVESMTTHESLFFRDGTPFDILEKVIAPRLINVNNEKTIRIWSSACSTGQEPYSIAMTLMELPEFSADWSYDIYATDISSLAIKKAKEGIYSDFEIHRGCPLKHLNRYFTQIDNNWKIKDIARKNIQFAEGNLLEPLFPPKPFNIIFCRNVLIYFNPIIKRKVLNLLSKALDAKGYLILGGTESIYGISDDFHHIDDDPVGVYRKRDFTDNLNL